MITNKERDPIVTMGPIREEYNYIVDYINRKEASQGKYNTR